MHILKGITSKKLIILLVIPFLLTASIAIAKTNKKAAIPQQQDAVQAIMLYDRSSNLYKETINVHKVLPIASITKLMTVYVVLESQANLNEMLTIQPQKIETSRVLRSGMKVSRQVLIELSLIASDNLAAKTLALNDISGYDGFVAKMNSTAHRIGMLDTHYIEPTGLLLNTSTVWDLHLLNKELFKYSVFSDSAMSRTANIHVKNNKGMWQQIAIRNTNIFAGEYDIRIGKTGFTNPAGFCINMGIRQGNQQFDIIVLGSPTKEIRTKVVAGHLKDYMNYITSKSVLKKIEFYDEPEIEFFGLQKR